MLGDQYCYAITLSGTNGNEVEQRSVAIDWDPALEWTRFEALRRRHPCSSAGARPWIEPIWGDSGQPDVRGFRVHLARGEESFSVAFPRQYFDAPAKSLGAECVAAGRLEADEVVHYRVTAFPSDRSPAPKDSDMLDVDEVTTPPRIEGSERVDFAGKTLIGAFNATDIPVVVPDRVVEEVRSLTLRSQGSETGGFLLGHLSRDDDLTADVSVNITVQLEAGHTLSELTRLTFTAQTWTDLRERMRLRNRNELLLGWWHSHPVREWDCKVCLPESQRRCPLAGDFFSEHDRALHRAVFSSAYSVGMVANDVAFSKMTFSMFGWRQGLLEARGFYSTPTSNQTRVLDPVSADGGSDAC